MDIITLSLAKKYANKVAAGFSKVEVQGNNLIFTLNDGTKATMTVPTPEKGSDGISIVDVSIDIDGNLLCHMSDGSTINAGKIAEYDLHSQELDNKIIDTRNELERVKNDVLETGTDTDTYIHLEDSAMAEYQELSVDGVCEQKTTTGKNFLNVPQDFTFTRSYELAVNIPAGTYHLTNSSLSASDGSYNIKLAFNDNKVSKFLNNNRDTKITLPSNETKVYIYSKGNYVDSNGITATIKKFMLSVDGGEYEPYTGGQPSPNPDYPQPISTIENSLKITSCNKNLTPMNIDSMTKGGITITNNNNGSLTLNGTATSPFELVLDSNFKLYAGTYTHSINKIFKGVYVSLDNIGDTMLNGAQGKTTTTFKLSEGKTYNKYFIWIDKDTVFNNDTFYIQLERGSTATPYEQHLETQIQANLPEGEFIGKINDTYKDTLKVEYNETDGQYHLNLYKNIGKFNFTFSQVSSNGINSNNFYYITPTIENALANYDNKCVSTHCDFKKNLGITSTKKMRGYVDLHLLNLSADATTSEALIKLKELYGNDNVISYYPLETPYIVDLGIVDMPITYNEITNLFTDSDLLPQINAKYYRNFISTVRNLQVNEKALKQELIDINTRLSALETAQTNVVSESEVV